MTTHAHTHTLSSTHRPPSGASPAAHSSWPRNTWGFPGSVTAFSGGSAHNSSGLEAKCWSTGESKHTRMASDGGLVAPRPARPACCQREAMEPGKPKWRVQSRVPMSTPVLGGEKEGWGDGLREREALEGEGSCGFAVRVGLMAAQVPS